MRKGKLILILAVGLAGCNISGEREYTIIEVSDHYGRCKYSLFSKTGFTSKHHAFVDKCGLFNVGDTVYIKLTPLLTK